MTLPCLSVHFFLTAFVILQESSFLCLVFFYYYSALAHSLTHALLNHNYFSARAGYWSLVSHSFAQCMMSFFSFFSCILELQCLYSGITVVTMPKFDLQVFLEAVQSYKLTRLHIVPPIVLALAKHPLVFCFLFSLSLFVHTVIWWLTVLTRFSSMICHLSR